MYSIPNSRVHELRGKEMNVFLNTKDKDEVIKALASLARTDSVLGNLFALYSHYLPYIYILFTIFLP